jgi:hypothetical protein
MSSGLKPIAVSFKEEEKYIHDYVKKQLNYSAYLKGLILKDMRQDKEINNKENG